MIHPLKLHTPLNAVQIGRGGYGVVYRGLYHGSEVAIKVIQEVRGSGGSCVRGGEQVTFFSRGTPDFYG